MKTLYQLVGCISLMALSAGAVPLQLHSQIDASFSPSASAGGDSSLPVMTPDGRFVLFASTANNLALAGSNAPFAQPQFHWMNVYLRDRASNSTVLVSVSLDGAAGADQHALPAGISTNGQFALFESAADNLVAGATNTFTKVFLRDIVHGTTTLISVNTNGVSGNGDSYSSVITPDGRFVAFASAASDLVTNDANGIPDVFLRDLQHGTTICATPGAKTTGSTTLLSVSDSPVITPDGQHVAFYSSATNLVPGQKLAGDVYVRNLVAGTTTWASSQARSQFQSLTGSTNAVSCSPCISDDGNYVAFEACTNLPNPSAARGIILRYSVASGQTDLVQTNSYVPDASFDSIQELTMTPDGRFVAHIADIGNASGANTAIYLWDAQSGINTLVSADTNNALPAAVFCDLPCVSADGQYVAFLSTAASLATNAAGNNLHVYWRDVAAGTTTLINAGAAGGTTNYVSVLGLCMSADGQSVAFDSTQPDLATNDLNGDSDIFLWNATSGSTEVISAMHPQLPSFTGDGYSTLATEPLSADGHYLAFASDADNLVPGDTNGMRDVFVRDLYQGTTILASAGLNGAGASGRSYEAAISGNGRYVAFTSWATNLVSGDAVFTNNVFVRDLQANTTALVSVNSAGTGPGNGGSHLPTISSDGRFVLFSSTATSLASGSYSSGSENLFLRDQQMGVTYAFTTNGLGYAAMTPDGHYLAFSGASGANSAIYVWDTQQAKRILTNVISGAIPAVFISPDGNRIAFLAGSATASLYIYDRTAKTTWAVGSTVLGSHPGLRFSADGNSLVYASAATTKSNQVYLCNIPAKTNVLVSHSADFSSQGDGASDWADLSADGRFVVYRSAADNLVAGDTNGVPDLYLYDKTTGSNVLLTASIYGNGAADNRSLKPVFSGDGRTLVFCSWGGDLVPGDFNQTSDIFAYAFLYATASATNGGSPTINWPTAPGQNFTVQYKDDLNDPSWHLLNGSVITNGNRACMTDTTPNSDHRFYRVVSDK